MTRFLRHSQQLLQPPTPDPPAPHPLADEVAHDIVMYLLRHRHDAVVPLPQLGGALDVGDHRRHLAQHAVVAVADQAGGVAALPALLRVDQMVPVVDFGRGGL